MSLQEDAELAQFALYAEDAFSTARSTPGANLLAPPRDPRISSDWTLRGVLTATDALFGPGSLRVASQHVFYGWWLERSDESVVAIRGTADALEWGIDGLFAPKTTHAVGGEVETGFWSVYRSMLCNGQPLSEIAKLARGRITVVGHSLGAAVATFAALDLAKGGAKVRGRFIASPHPGDGAFARAFGAIVPDHMAYANSDDVVPRVPFWFGYTHVPNLTTLSPAKEGVRIDGGLPAQHHVMTYIALVDRPTFEAFKPLPIDEKFLACVHFSEDSHA